MDELVILLSARAWASKSKVQRVVQKCFVASSHIQHYWKSAARIDTSTQCIQDQLGNTKSIQHRLPDRQCLKTGMRLA